MLRAVLAGDKTLHAGGAVHVAHAGEACLRLRLLRTVWLLVMLPALQNHFLLQCQVSGVSSLTRKDHATSNSSELEIAS